MVPLKDVFGTAMSALVLSMTLAGAASATDIYNGSMSIASTDATQLGRLSRSGVPSDWSEPKVFPGVINTTSRYHYSTLTLDLDALEAPYQFGSYIQITFDSLSATTFLSAYLGSYSSTNLQTNYLGDAGTSGNYFGTDPLSFQLLLQPGTQLVLVLNESATNGGLNQIGNVLIEAFADSEYTDLSPAVPAVPEPGTYALLAGGFALLGARRLQKRVAAAPATV